MSVKRENGETGIFIANKKTRLFLCGILHARRRLIFLTLLMYVAIIITIYMYISSSNNLVNYRMVGIGQKASSYVFGLQSYISKMFNSNSSKVDTPVIRNSTMQNIVHYIIDKYNYRICIHHYVSVFSAVKYFQPEHIMFHAVIWPWEESDWWRAILQLSRNIQIRKISYPDCRTTNIDFKRDFLKIIILQQYGGLILNLDTFIVNPMDQLKSYDVVLGKANSDEISMSVIMANKDSLFLEIWLNAVNESSSPSEMRENIVKLPLELSSSHHMENTRVEESSLTLPSAKDVDSKIFNGVFDWRRNYCVSLHTLGSECMDFSFDDLMTVPTAFGEMIRHIIYNDSSIIETYIPNIVHYFWDKPAKEELTFIEYLSIASAHHVFNPIKIMFYYTELPSGEYWDYVREIPELDMVSLASCKTNSNKTISAFRNDVIWKEGGIFLDLAVIVLNPMRFLQGLQTVASFDATHVNDDYLLIHPGTTSVAGSSNNNAFSKLEVSLNSSSLDQRNKPTCWNKYCLIRTTSIDQKTLESNFDPGELFYVRVLPENASHFNKQSIQSLDTNFGQVARFVINGFNDLIDENKFIVPNIVHFIWFGEYQPFTLLHLICFYSAYVMQKPDRIILHFETLPTGPLWENIQEVVPIELRKTNPPTQVFGQDIDAVQHKADVARLQILKQFGGIYLDTDIIVLRSLDPLRIFPYSVGEETVGSLANGLILCKNGSEFLKLFYDSYRTDYNDYSWQYNSVVVHGNLGVKHRPDKIHIGPSDRLFRPTYRECDEIWDNGSVLYWRDNYILHLYCKDEHFDEFSQEILSKQSKTSYAGIVGRYFYHMFIRDFNKPRLSI